MSKQNVGGHVGVRQTNIGEHVGELFLISFEFPVILLKHVLLICLGHMLADCCCMLADCFWALVDSFRMLVDCFRDV